MKRVQIVLADDHIMVSDAIKELLEPEFEVIGAFTDGLALVEAAPRLHPDVVVLDIGMPTMNGLNAGYRLKQMMPSVKLVYLTMNPDPDLAAEAFRLGASGYLLKNSAASELVQAIREVARGGSYVTPLMTKDIFVSFVQSFKSMKSSRKLTVRQKEVLQLLAEGHSMKEAAFILNVAPSTVAYHKYNMMAQLHLKSGAELIQYAMKNSLTASVN